MYELTFGPCKNSKTVISRIFILEKGRLGAAVQNGSTKNFEVPFFGYAIKNLAFRILYFWLFSFVLEHPQKHIVLEWDEFGSLGLRGISPMLNIAINRESSRQPFLLGIEKTVFLNFQFSRFGWTTQKRNFRDKNPRRLHKTSFVFSQRQK